MILYSCHERLHQIPKGERIVCRSTTLHDTVADLLVLLPRTLLFDRLHRAYEMETPPQHPTRCDE